MSRLLKSTYSLAFRLVSIALIAALAAGIIGPAGTALASPGWYDTDWSYRKQITINGDNVTASLTDFPVLVSLTTDADLAADALDSGYDILFTAADEVTKLPHEIESFNGTTGELLAWVKIPTLPSGSDTDIYMYYGSANASNQQNAAGVWDSNFRMVQHLEETSGGAYAITDSTSNSNNGTDTNSPTLGATGSINGAATFGTGNDYILVDDSSSLDISGNITLEAWIYPTTIDGTHRRIIIKPLSSWAMPYYEYSLWVYGTGADNLGFGISDGSTRVYEVYGSLSTGTWQHVAGTFNGTTLKWYINGEYITQMSTGTVTSIGTNNEPVSIGSVLPLVSNLEFDGTIDEVRISSTDRSADWLKTGYNNQSNPGDFLTLGSEENAPSTPTVTTGDATNVEETSADLHGNITATGGENADERGFEWGTSSGSYTSNWTETAGGPYGTGAYTAAGLSPPFDKGERYFFRAMAHNSAGWGYGDEKSFLTKPDGPTGLTVSGQGNNWIYLTWSNGTGSQKTMVRYATGDYPADETSGEQGYFDSGTSVNITGLDPGTIHYFRAWSYATEGGLEQYSDLYSQASGATTGSPTPSVIGGLVLPINKANVLAPWIFLGVIASIVIARIIVYLRRKRLSRPDKRDTGQPNPGYE